MLETRRLMLRTAPWSLLLVSGVVRSLAGQATIPARGAVSETTPLPTLVAIRDLTPREHRSQAFVLAAPAVIRVEAVGAVARGGLTSPWAATAWILDARTRQVVWDLRTARAAAEPTGMRRFSGEVALAAGTYELHYASYPATSVSTGSGNLLRDLKSALDGNRRALPPRYGGPYVDDSLYHQFGVTLSGAGRAGGYGDLTAARRRDLAMVALVHPVRHGATARTAFALSRPATLDVTALGELRADHASDAGWLIDADSRKVIWRMSWAKSTAAGGAARNREEHAVLALPAGRYVAWFSNDDGYDPEEWTAMPPPDPDSWGLILRIASPTERAVFRSIEWRPVPDSGTLATITRVGDGEQRTADFTLSHPARVQLHAVGEASGETMVDVAWLTDLDRHRRVWTMKASESSWAGGAAKNLQYDGVLPLPAGHYQLNYTSDDSHAFGDWNAAPPLDPEYWGVSAWEVAGAVDPGVAIPVITAAKAVPLVAIHHVANNIDAQVEFRLATDDSVRVYAIGEGSSGGMNDYATIEDAVTHRSVWAMRYQQTVAAGGAEKNRQFDGVVALKAGRYILRWRSDGSHGWGSWNDDPPDDQEGWGVAVSRVQAGGGRR